MSFRKLILLCIFTGAGLGEASAAKVSVGNDTYAYRIEIMADSGHAINFGIYNYDTVTHAGMGYRFYTHPKQSTAYYSAGYYQRNDTYSCSGFEILLCGFRDLFKPLQGNVIHGGVGYQFNFSNHLLLNTGLDVQHSLTSNDSRAYFNLGVHVRF